MFPDLDFLRYFTSGLGWVEVGNSLIASLLCWVIEGLLSTTGLGGCTGVGLGVGIDCFGGSTGLGGVVDTALVDACFNTIPPGPTICNPEVIASSLVYFLPLLSINVGTPPIFIDLISLVELLLAGLTGSIGLDCCTCGLGVGIDCLGCSTGFGCCAGLGVGIVGVKLFIPGYLVLTSFTILEYLST